MSNDTIKEIINDTHDLASACKDPLTKLAIEGIENRLQTLCDAGLYVTPKEVFETVAGARPLDAIMANPPFDGKRATIQIEKRDWLELPRNINLQRYVMSDRSTMFVGQYVNAVDKSPAVRPARIYRIEVRRLDHPEGWNVEIWDDKKLLVTSDSCLNRAWSEYMAVKQLKAILTCKVRNCAKAHRRAKTKRAERAASALSPAEELAETVKRQKEI